MTSGPQTSVWLDLFFASGVGLLFADNGSNSLEFIAGLELDQLYALRISASLTDALDEDTNHLAGCCDQHNLIGFTNRKRTDHAARALVGLHGDDAFAAARLQPINLFHSSVFKNHVKGSAFADAILTSNEEGGVTHDDG